MTSITPRTFETWLDAYKAAWESRDEQAASRLFSNDAEYYWTPFDPPQRGHREIATAWKNAVAQQQDVTFTYAVIAVTGERAVAHWHTRLTSVPKGERVELDGILIAEFAEPLRCRTFREWWHVVTRP
jgi:ketosteroid isomerase-like protein